MLKKNQLERTAKMVVEALLKIYSSCSPKAEEKGGIALNLAPGCELQDCDEDSIMQVRFILIVIDIVVMLIIFERHNYIYTDIIGSLHDLITSYGGRC